MATVIVPAGSLRTTTQAAVGNGTFVVEADAFVLPTIGSGLTLVRSGAAAWAATINGGVQAQSGDGIQLIGSGTFVSSVAVGADGFVFGNGAGNSGIDSDGALNITNNGFIGGQQNAVLINSPSAASFTINNTASGVLSSSGNTVQVTGTTGGTQTLKNAGQIVNAVLFNGLGNVVVNNTGTMSTIGLGNGSDTVTNSGTTSTIGLSGGNNKLVNSGVTASVLGGTGNDTINNTGTIADVQLDIGTNSLTNAGLAFSYLGGNDADTVTNSGAIANSVQLRDGINKLTNQVAGTIGGSVVGGIQNDTVINAGRISGLVSLFDGDNVVNNTGTITGAVTLGTGTNRLTNSGSIGGSITCGSGNDTVTNFVTAPTVVAGKITGIVDLLGGNDTFNGGSNSETVRDGDGSDKINLGGGADTYIATGASDTLADTIDGGGGIDAYDGSAFASVALINLAGVDRIDPYSAFFNVSLTKTSATVGFSTDTITNFENASGGNGDDIILGNAQANFLSGNLGADDLLGFEANDTLAGGSGADRIVGGAGADRLSGGGSDGATDRFIYEALADSGPTAATRDFITDFQTTDLIDMSAIDSSALLAGIQHTFTFLGTNQDFTGVAGQMRALQIGSSTNGPLTLVQADVNGDQKADFSIALSGLISLTSGNFDFTP